MDIVVVMDTGSVVIDGSNEQVAIVQEVATSVITEGVAGPPGRSMFGYSAKVGDGVTLAFSIQHPLGTDIVVCQLRRTDTGEIVSPYTTMQAVGVDTVLLVFPSPPSQDQYTLIVLG